jgi:hypothetical protein
MKWMQFAAAALLLAAAGTATAAEPQPTTIRSASPRGSFSVASNWWARFGEPVNQEQLETSAPATVVVDPEGHAMGNPGYVYGPGACDYTPPCVDWLWNGYYQNPKRCHPDFVQKFCGSCRKGCGLGNGCGCNVAADCGCGAPAASCDCAAPSVPDCGCETGCKKCKHFHWSWHKLKHRCGLCDCADVSCVAPTCEASCAAPTCEGLAPAVEPAPQPVPEAPLSFRWKPVLTRPVTTTR